MAPPVVPKLKLSNGYEIPVLGLGTWKSKPGEVTQAVKDAIDAGYRHLDCAITYRNEKEVGEAIKTKIAEGVIKREDLFITSKLWNTSHRPDLVIPALKQSLQNLGVSYLDMYLIHWPFAFQEGEDYMPKDEDGNMLFSDVDYVDTWKSMEEGAKLGLTRSIGFSNFNHEQVSRVLDIATIKPVYNQVECHPYLNQAKMLEWCSARGLQMAGYSPLGSRDSSYAKPGGREILDDPRLAQLAAKYARTPAQVALRYQVQRGVVVVPKSVTKKRIIENINIFDFEISKEDMAYIDTFDCKGRICTVAHSSKHKYYPFSAEF